MGHGGVLNFGDCFSYALAKSHDAPLLFAGVPVVVASEVWAWLDGRLPIAELSPAVFLHQPGFGAIHWETFNRLTRVVDVVLASLMLICATPLLLAGALAVPHPISEIREPRPDFPNQGKNPSNRA